MRVSYWSFHCQMRLHQLLAAEVVAGLLLLLAQAAFDHGLRGDAGVVGAGHPEGVVALHAPPADQHVLQGVVEGVAHVQGAGDVRRRDDDAERLAVRVGLGCGNSRARPRTAASAAGLPWGRTAWGVRSPWLASLSQKRPETPSSDGHAHGAAGFGVPPSPRRAAVRLPVPSGLRRLRASASAVPVSPPSATLRRSSFRSPDVA